MLLTDTSPPQPVSPTVSLCGKPYLRKTWLHCKPIGISLHFAFGPIECKVPYVDNWGLFLSANNAEPDFFEKWNYRLLSHHRTIFDWWREPEVVLTVSQLALECIFQDVKANIKISLLTTYSVRQHCIFLHSIGPKACASVGRGNNRGWKSMEHYCPCPVATITTTMIKATTTTISTSMTSKLLRHRYAGWKVSLFL